MNKHYFSKLAATNLKKNSKSYIPYILVCIVTVAMFYIVKSLSLNPGLEKMVGSDTLTYLMFLVSIGVALFSVVFLFYTNSFLVKNRKKEFGVFNILGMEKSHLVKVLGLETLYVAVISLTAGLILGIALDKVMFLLIARVIGADIVLGFFVSSEAILTTLLLFAAIFFLVFVNSARQIKIASPVELLSAGKVGEKEPKTKWLIAVLGLFSTVAGYIIAVTVGTPKTAIGKFFVAALLVAVGTYLLFTAGSIALLKMLRKNKRYYYKANHFISISSMIYRMKQNAVGLATICILSTAVLIMLSSVSSLMIGIQKYYKDYKIQARQKVVLCIMMLLAVFYIASRADYGIAGVALIVGLYIAREKKQRIILTVCLWGVIFYGVIHENWYNVMFTCVAGGLLCLYNGEKGMSVKYLFYFFYPVHLGILGIINILIRLNIVDLSHL